jgi:hypothetical protein
MDEADVVNLALTVRVLLVGAILLSLPRITRKGLLFGTYIGEALADREAARRLVGRWDVGCAILMLLSLLVGLGISFAGRPVAGSLTGTAVLLLGGLGLYLRFHSSARELAPPVAALQAAKATAPLDSGEPKGLGLARLALAICVLSGIATFAYAIVSQKAMSARPFAAVMFLPSLNLVLSPFLALIALLTAHAKRSVRGGSGGGSIEAQDAFRATMSRLTSWMALLICATLTLLSVEIIRVGPSKISSLGVGIGLMAGIVVVFILVNLIRVLREYGQGGARIERGTVEAPLTNGLADNTRWVWGVFYVDRDDPSILVEKRFGIGYTFNYGNRTAILILVGFLGLIFGLIAFAVYGIWINGG